MADRDFWIIGDPDGIASNVITAMAWIGRYDYVRVNDFEHMVLQLLQRLSPDDRIRSLFISDHGSSMELPPEAVGLKIPVGGTQFVGRTEIRSWENGDDSMGPRKLAAAFAPLRPRLAPGARVFLTGCTVGRADQLLSGISLAFGGVPISGSTSYQHAFLPLPQGTIRTCVQLPGALPQCSIEESIGPAWAFHWAEDIVVNQVMKGIQAAKPVVLHVLEPGGEAVGRGYFVP